MKKYGIKGNREVAAKGEILFETDTLDNVTLKQGVIYYLNADCTLDGVAYKKGYYSYNGVKLIPFGGGGDYGLPVHTEQITDYVWQLKYDNLNYIYAKENIDNGYSFNASCTAIYIYGILGRNLDWHFGKEIEAVIRTPKTVAICGGLKNLTQEKMLDGTADKGDLKLLPFYVKDGMNNGGLACCLNVVPSTGNTASVPTISTKHTISAYCLCRYILDNFDNALEACQMIKQYVSIVFTPGLEVHYFVADKDNCYCLEVVNNEVVYQPANVMTNFHINGVTFDADGKVHTPEDGGLPHQTQNVDEYGEGLERYNDMVEALPAIVSVDDVFSQALDTVLYTKAYTTSKFYTEFVDETAGLTVDSTVGQLSVPQAEAKDYYDSFADDEARRADGKLWHTTHSSVYDIANNILKIKFNEDTTNVFTFTLPFNFNDCFTVVDGKLCAVYESED